MSNPVSTEELFRKAAEAEGGASVSAGARLSHVRMALESGRLYQLDLSCVPEAKRPALIATIKDLVALVEEAPPQRTQNGGASGSEGPKDKVRQPDPTGVEEPSER